eukprot:TRINITY_DN3120_c0_g1_i1.p1 TRINITY_DN3120_c0_g1~~TRINITY_DN3120_c0_g1_i1.p1  ORF type:complete len:124 (+),score=24.48 TRINITY_DN3120_c0_g1_i1:84-455(+)
MLLLGRMDEQVYDVLYAGQTGLFTLSRIPQIWSNFANRSTGQLSFATTFLNFAGCIARLFTYIQEKAPFSMVIGSLLGIVCHGTLVAQILFYNWSLSVAEKKAGGAKLSTAELQEDAALKKDL